MSQKLVSIVIPTFNRAYCLPVALGSLQRQTYASWEAIVVDDGSTDDTAFIVADLVESDSRIKYSYQDNAGVSAARNAGLRGASGKYVAFLDSDDSWAPWKLEAQVACLQKLPSVGMIWTDMDAVNTQGEVVSRRHLRKMYGAYKYLPNIKAFSCEKTLSELAPQVRMQEDEGDIAKVLWGDLYTAMIFGNLVHTSTVLLSRKRQEAVGLFNESFRTGEDYEFHLRTCHEGPVALLDIPSIKYRIAGSLDQLTSPGHMLEIATNALSIRRKAIENNRSAIALTDRDIAKIISRAHRWVAEEYWKRNDLVNALEHFRQSGIGSLRNSKTIVKALICHLPLPMARALRRALLRN